MICNWQTLYSRLEREGQTHLIRHLETLSGTEKETFLSALAGIDFSYLKRGETSFQNRVYEISPIDIFTAEKADARRTELDAAGLDAVRSGKVAAVLLCGGQGTRLGFDHPKGMYDIGLTRPLPIFGFHFACLCETARRAGAWFPVFVMTSRAGDAQVREFLASHCYFGYDSRYVRTYVQDMAPATDFDGRLLLSGKTSLAMSPNGNGGWFSSLVLSGLLSGAQYDGVEWFNVVSIDNVLQKTADPSFIGATLLSGADCGAKVIRKASPDERIGLICRNEGHPAVIEYYELDRLLKEGAVCTDGIEYGVILNYLFRRERMERTPEGELPVHRVRKKIPYYCDGRTVFPEQENGYKYEMLATDLVERMDSCLPYEVRRAEEFAPVKNRHGVDSVDSAREMLSAAGYML